MMSAILFGKLPAHGDFVSRGIPAAERDALDLWLAASLAAANDALGDAFEETYDLAQPWRFAWAEGGAWTAGAMAPSVDGVGRRYPIVVALRGLGAEAVEHVATAAEAAIYDALAGGWTADTLIGAMATVAPSSGGEWTSPPGWWTVDDDGAVAARVDGARPPDLIRAVLTLGVEGGVAQEGGAWA